MFKQALRSLVLMWQHTKSVVIINVLIVIITAGLVPIDILYRQKMIDNILLYYKGQVNLSAVIVPTVILGVIMVISALRNVIKSSLDIRCDRLIINAFSTKIVNKFQKLEYSCFEDEKSNNTIHRMSKEPYFRIKEVFIQVLVILQSICIIWGLIIIYVQVSIWLVIALVVLTVPILWVNYIASLMWFEVYNNQSDKERHLNYLSSILCEKKSLLELKVFRAIHHVEKLWEDTTKEVIKDKSKILIKTQIILFIRSALSCVWYAITLIILMKCLINNSISIGLFISLCSSAFLVVNEIKSLSNAFGTLSRSALEIQHFEHFITLPEITQCEDKELGELTAIKFENVRFKYPNKDEEILKGVSFEIKPNESIALVGRNGEGKSTIIKLLCKLYKPTSGKITINGIDLQEIPYKKLAAIISIVFQDYYNYELSLRENVAIGDISRLNYDDDIKKALRESSSSGILQQVSNRLDSNLGKLEDDGVDLSGGQWQRLAVSRSYFPNAKIIVLDEPTASMDPIAESEMYYLFTNVMKEKGTIMISHRLASAKLADKILVLNQGIVAESGTHDDLMKKQGLYANMFNEQASWYKAE